MIGQDYVNNRIINLGPPNAYYFEVKKADGTVGQSGETGLDLAEPPVKVLIDFGVDFDNEDRKEEVTRYSLQNRVVKVFCASKTRVVKLLTKIVDGKEVPDIDEVLGTQKESISYKENEPMEIGSFVVNSLNVNWDLYDVLKKHPLALKCLVDICMSYHLGNLLPSQN